MGIAALVLMSLGLFTGCASSAPTENTANGELRAAVLRGVAQIRGTHDEGLPSNDPAFFLNGFHETWPIPYGEAAFGFATTLRGIESRLAFTRNDSGNVEAATRTPNAQTAR